jgi:hypothetical protein
MIQKLLYYFAVAILSIVVFLLAFSLTIALGNILGWLVVNISHFMFQILPSF